IGIDDGADVHGDGELLQSHVATLRVDLHMGDAGRPCRRGTLLRRDAGDADALVLRQLDRTVAGAADGRAQRVGEALGTADILRLLAPRHGAGAAWQRQPGPLPHPPGWLA